MGMKSFRPKGVTAIRATGGRGGYQERDYPKDRLVRVERIDPVRKILFGVDVKDNLKIEASIYVNPDYQPTSSQASTTDENWQGNMIDERMAEAIEPGSLVVLGNCRGVTVQMIGRERVLPVTTRWVNHMTDLDDTKVFPGIFTIQSFRDEVRSVQHWNERSISLNDKEALTKFAEELDHLAEESENQNRPIRKGFQFRVMEMVEPAVPAGGGRPERPPVYNVINLSYPIDWLIDEDKKAADPDYIGLPPTGEDFENMINGFMSHVWGVEGSEDPDEQPMFEPEVLEKLVIEIAVYDYYKGGKLQYCPRLRIPQPDPEAEDNRVLPLYSLANTPTRYSPDEEYVKGRKNWAVQGILRLTGDSFDKKAKEIVVLNLARELFCNGLRGNVHSMVRASDGGRVKVDPSLDRPVEHAAANSELGGQEGGSQEGVFSQEPILDTTQGADPFNTPADPFLDASPSQEEEATPKTDSSSSSRRRSSSF